MSARPWLQFYGDVPPQLEYPEASLYASLAAVAERTPDAIAYDFVGCERTYRELVADVDRCAAALAMLGVHAGDRVTIALPTCPQGVVAFYATNRLGAVASMVHPLSTSDEIAFALAASGSRVAIALDALRAPFDAARSRTPLRTLVLARLGDALRVPQRLGWWWLHGRRVPRTRRGDGVLAWRDWLATPHAPAPLAGGAADPAAILYSGGTTGTPKGVVLTNRNLLAEGLQVAAWVGLRADDAILAILPLFHGFGLGVCVNATLLAGGRAILVPTFTADEVARLLRRKRPTLLAGVPTLYAALAKHPALQHADLSCLRAAFSGADTLPSTVRDAFESLVRRRGGTVRLLEGYGLTEAVSAIMAMPLAHRRDGTIGVPFPDMLAKICTPGTSDEVAHGTEGEICVSGPAVMQGYLDSPDETAAVLRVHPDGRTWLHTDDLGTMDADGCFRFTCRLKRMIKSSGFNVYPAQVEAVLLEHPAVAEACVVGVPDPQQVERVRAYVVASAGTVPGDALAAELVAHCRTRLLKWSCPREVEFRDALPRTRVGKIDYRALAGQVQPAPERAA